MSDISPPQKIFVTGGAGFIGSAVTRALTAAGFGVRCLVRATTDVSRIKDVPFERVEGDVRDAAAVARGFEGCAAAVHLASLSNWNDIDSPLMREVVEGGTRNVLEAARALGGKRVVFVSSASAINGSEDPKVFDESAPFELAGKGLSYCEHKREAEKLCLSSGVPVVIVNPTEVYGPGDTALITAGNLVDFAKSAPVLVCAGGTSVAHVDDVANGIVGALVRGRPGERYILGGENLTVRQLAELTLELLGKKSKIMALPNTVIRATAKTALTLRLPLPFNPRVIPYATRYWFMDSSKATRELGVTFRSARATLEPTLAWLRDTGRIQA